VRAVAAAAAVTLEVERLDAELRAKVEELRASRARLVESADAARRRIERDLHDGAQQRLVALALKLRLVQERADGDDQLTRDLKAARDELDAALDELRELARGIHPTVLSDRGLRAALEALARRAPIPVDLEGVPDERLPESVESTAYFVVAEALTNVAKYAGASHVRVRVGRRDSTVTVEVSDDGRGGADPNRGSGLRGLRERLSALEGRLEVESPPGDGTTVRAEIPDGGSRQAPHPSNSGAFIAATPRGRSAGSSLIAVDRFSADGGRPGSPCGRSRSAAAAGVGRSWRADARRLYRGVARAYGAGRRRRGRRPVREFEGPSFRRTVQPGPAGCATSSAGRCETR
jgi:two-component sensor histidine kinase